MKFLLIALRWSFAAEWLLKTINNALLEKFIKMGLNVPSRDSLDDKVSKP